MERLMIRDIPEENRPRERLIAKGAEALSNAELLAVILRTGSWKENVVDLCNRLLSEYDLRRLGECRLNELKMYPGIGEAKACQIAAAVELAKRIASYRGSDEVFLNSPAEVYRIFSARLKPMKKEMFLGLYLDTRNRLIAEEMISLGTLNSSIVHPREIFKTAIRESANSIILVHNHPSGYQKPSREDIEVTKRIVEAGNIIDIKVVDHVIIGEENFFSFALEKLI